MNKSCYSKCQQPAESALFTIVGLGRVLGSDVGQAFFIFFNFTTRYVGLLLAGLHRVVDVVITGFANRSAHFIKG